jgi:hypothetical protein
MAAPIPLAVISSIVLLFLRLSKNIFHMADTEDRVATTMMRNMKE